MAKWQVGVEETTLLTEMTKELLAVSTVRPGQRIQRGVNTTGRSLLTPGYNDAQRATYPAFWVRDPAWIAESSLIPAEEVWGWLTLLTETMRGPEPWHLASGGVVLPYSLPDHINIDGSPVYFPGTYAADETQGPPWGKYPPHDDQYWLTYTAWIYAQLTRDWESFERLVPTPMGQMPLYEVCELTHNAFPVDPETQLCIASADLNEHIVDWGYNDSIIKTGKLLFPSLLRLQSARKLLELFSKSNNPERADRYREQVAQLQCAIEQTFFRKVRPDEWWLMSATGIGCQPDVWGSAFAVYMEAIDRDKAAALARSLLRGYRLRTTVVDGQACHLPNGDGPWQKALSKPGTYQNGGYWGYPMGWYIYAVSLVDENAAAELFAEYLTAVRRNWSSSFKACAWECVNPAIDHYQNPGYLATVALPYVTLKEKGLLEGAPAQYA
jgi:hypothetical protein